MHNLQQDIHARQIQDLLWRRMFRKTQETGNGTNDKNLETKTWRAKVAANTLKLAPALQVLTLPDTDTARPAWCSSNASSDVRAATSLPKDADGITRPRRDVQ